MRWLIFFLLVLVLIGGGMKLTGMQLPVLDYPLGGVFFGPPEVDLTPGGLPQNNGGNIVIPLH